MVMRSFSFATVFALLPWATSSMGMAEPIAVRDAFDRTVTVPAPPQRIVTIFASNTEMVAALGLADRIVGIEAYTRYPPEVSNKPLVGGRLGFSVDAIVSARPTSSSSRRRGRLPTSSSIRWSGSACRSSS
jgi:iron complex transport system substrate-binding protein